MVIAHIGPRHILMPNTGDTLANFFALHTRNIAQHSRFTKILFGEIIGRQRRRVIRRQRNQMVENTGFSRRISLEGLDLLIRLLRQIGSS